MERDPGSYPGDTADDVQGPKGDPGMGPTQANPGSGTQVHSPGQTAEYQ